jgi:hypothetical protein
MVHALARHISVAKAQCFERGAGEGVVVALDFLEAQDVDRVRIEKLLDEMGPGADAVDVPACYTERTGAERHAGGIGGVHAKRKK